MKTRKPKHSETEMKVSEFIEWLKTQDQDSIVQCVVHNPSGGYYEQGGTAAVKEFTPEFSEYTDFRDNQFVGPNDLLFGKRYLLIGEHE
jgi:hypothetical protein